MEIWGIVNVTPDSFSDGGEHLDPQRAISHGRGLIVAGATVLDVGGESTRPGSLQVGADEELRRVLPVIGTLADDGATVSVDTYRSEVAAAAIAAGAKIVNDVSGGLEDPRILDVVAESDADIVLGHWRGPSADMYAMARYESVGAEIAAELRRRVDAALAAGVRPERIVLDPGIGFAKDAAQSWQALRELGEVTAFGHRVLVGASRKGFLRTALGEEASRGRRDLATAVISVLAAQHGAHGVRVHDAAATADALAVAAAWAGEGEERTSEGTTATGTGSEGRRADAIRASDDRSVVPAAASEVQGAIVLTGLRVFGRHGVFDFERENGQEFVVDLELRVDTAPAAGSDHVGDTVHYGELAEKVAAIVAGDPANLIETLAERIASAVLEDGRIRSARVTVHKPQAPIELPFDDVSVTVERARSDAR